MAVVDHADDVVVDVAVVPLDPVDPLDLVLSLDLVDLVDTRSVGNLVVVDRVV